MLKKRDQYQKVFKGCFKNPDDDTSLFLQEDDQTRFTGQERIQNLANRINDDKNITTLAEIYASIRRAAPYRKPEKADPLLISTAAQIIERGHVMGCTDCAVVFATLARAKGIPTIVVDGAQVDWIRKGADPKDVWGHFFVEVFLGSKWRLVDPTKGILFNHYDRNNWNLPGGYTAFAKALSPTETGFSTDQEHDRMQQEAFKTWNGIYTEPECGSFHLETVLRGSRFSRRQGNTKKDTPCPP